MVGDTPWDVRAAQRARVSTIAVLTGGFSAQELHDAGALSVFESVRELCTQLSHTALR
jgi:phosphoglycolate phosphatase-like HAD superfamily hydrolase